MLTHGFEMKARPWSFIYYNLLNLAGLKLNWGGIELCCPLSSGLGGIGIWNHTVPCPWTDELLSKPQCNKGLKMTGNPLCSHFCPLLVNWGSLEGWETSVNEQASRPAQLLNISSNFLLP